MRRRDHRYCIGVTSSDFSLVGRSDWVAVAGCTPRSRSLEVGSTPASRLLMLPMGMKPVGGEPSANVRGGAAELLDCQFGPGTGAEPRVAVDEGDRLISMLVSRSALI